MTVNNSTFAGNSATYVGGGFSNFDGLVTVSDSSFVDNSAAIDGGGGIGTAGFRSLTVSNSIVAGNTARSGPDLLGPVDPRSSFNLIADGSGLTGIGDGVSGNQIGTADNPLDPMLGPLADNGGPTLTFALLPGSPALGGGGPGTVLVDPIDATATSLPVDHAAGLAVSPGLVVQIDDEQLLITAVDTVSSTFTVVRGANGTTATDHDAGAGLLPTSDQRGAPRVVDGSLDVGAYQSQPTTRLVALRGSESIRIDAVLTRTVPPYDTKGDLPFAYLGTVVLAMADLDSQSPNGGPCTVHDAGTHETAALPALCPTPTALAPDPVGDGAVSAAPFVTWPFALVAPPAARSADTHG